MPDKTKERALEIININIYLQDALIFLSPFIFNRD